MKEEIYINLLRQARRELDESPEGITLDEFKARVKDYRLSLNRVTLFQDIYNNGHNANQGGRYHMCFDAYMQLIEYEEFHHALEESKQARKEAKIAIRFAVAAIVVQIALWVIDKFF